MHDNATKVMNAQALPDLSLCWERDARRDLSKTLNQESEWLCWNVALVTPVKDAIDKKRLETL
jgi:hypothetical protein